MVDGKHEPLRSCLRPRLHPSFRAQINSMQCLVGTGVFTAQRAAAIPAPTEGLQGHRELPLPRCPRWLPVDRALEEGQVRGEQMSRMIFIHLGRRRREKLDSGER